MNFFVCFCFANQKLSSDVFEAFSDDLGDAGEASPSARSSSQGSLYSLDDLNDKENRGKEVRNDNKNRLSFKLVNKMKVLLMQKFLCIILRHPLRDLQYL
jgi:hypothetical protein